MWQPEIVLRLPSRYDVFVLAVMRAPSRHQDYLDTTFFQCNRRLKARDLRLLIFTLARRLTQILTLVDAAIRIPAVSV
jgi:hypothetical protein